MKQFLTRIGVILMAALPLACTAADSPQYKMGEHYYSVRQAQPAAADGKIQVTEVFWYGCPHCYKFDPYVERWLDRKAGDVEFQRMPSSLGRPDGLMHSRAMYTADALGILKQFHPVFFAAIHEQHQPMNTPDAIAGVFERMGIARMEFDNTFNGFAVDSRVRKAEQLVRDFGITSVPSVVVDGRWWTNATLAGGSNDKFLQVVDHLVAKARQDRGASK